MKSSSRLVGALALGDQAEKLEMAGKEGNIEYISANHAKAHVCMAQKMLMAMVLYFLYSRGVIP